MGQPLKTDRTNIGYWSCYTLTTVLGQLVWCLTWLWIEREDAWCDTLPQKKQSHWSFTYLFLLPDTWQWWKPHIASLSELEIDYNPSTTSASQRTALTTIFSVYIRGKDRWDNCVCIWRECTLNMIRTFSHECRVLDIKHWTNKSCSLTRWPWEWSSVWTGRSVIADVGGSLAGSF